MDKRRNFCAVLPSFFEKIFSNVLKYGIMKRILSISFERFGILRVIAGFVKGHKLISPKGLDTRPTADRIKQSIFNMIEGDLKDCVFLDLFSGTGAMGIEALSRGAQKSIFVEKNRTAMQCIRRNLEHTKMTGQSDLYLMAAEQALKEMARKDEKVDIAFLDPPYAQAGDMEKLTYLLKVLDILEEDGYLIGEHAPETDIGSFEGLSVFKQKQYSKTTAITFWRPI